MNLEIQALYSHDVEEFLSSHFSRELIENFDCGEPHLNDFLRDESLILFQGGITKTILFFDIQQNQNKLLAYASLSASETQLAESEIFELGVNAQIPTRHIPSIRLTHLAVHREYQGLGLGKQAIQIIKDLLISQFDSYFAYRLLVVDARNNERVIDFYEKNNFFRCSQDDKQRGNSRTRHSVEMYCDLLA